MGQRSQQTEPAHLQPARALKDFALDGAIWLIGLGILALAHGVIGWLPLNDARRETLEAIHMNTVYGLLLVVSAGVISRVVVAALERLGHWEPR